MSRLGQEGKIIQKISRNCCCLCLPAGWYVGTIYCCCIKWHFVNIYVQDSSGKLYVGWKKSHKDCCALKFLTGFSPLLFQTYWNFGQIFKPILRLGKSSLNYIFNELSSWIKMTVNNCWSEHRNKIFRSAIVLF